MWSSLSTCVYSTKVEVGPSIIETKGDMFLKSGVVYKITCSRCKLCYVGQTSRHLLNRIKEHKKKNSPVGIQFDLCKCSLSMDDVCVWGSSSRSITRLMTLEALWINHLKPSINTKDEYRSRTLVIKI